MRTAQLILQIIQILQKNPDVLEQIPWNDLKECVTDELTARHFLYSEIQYQDLMRKLMFLFEELTQKASNGSTHEIIRILENLNEILAFFPELQALSLHYESANFDHACLRHLKQDTIIVLGDSHVNFFSGNELLNFLPIGNDINICPMKTHYLFTPLHLGPCLAYHCTDTDTKVQFQEKISYLLHNFVTPHATLVCSLGEIDLRVHVFQQTCLQNKPYEEIVDHILQPYCAFLSDLQKCGYRIYCWGPIATQPDTCPIDPAYPRTGSETDRNMATAYFNDCLNAYCQQHNIGFLSIFPHMVTSDFHTRSEFLSSDQCHLGQAALPLALPEWAKINHPILPDTPL